MVLGPKTKIDDLLSSYPFLLEFFLGQSPRFKILKNPVSRKTIGKVATLTQVATFGGLPLDQFLSDIAAEIKAETGEDIAFKQEDTGVRTPAKESGETRQEVLKGIIKDLHDGVDMEVLKQRFRELVKDIDASEIAAMEQALIEEGMPESEIKRLCDVHVEVFKESLEDQGPAQAPPGHPVQTFMLENRAAEEIIRETAPILDQARDSSEEDFSRHYQGDLKRLLDRLADIDIHYLRKENQLFPLLEEHGVEGPSQVMWALHDDIRDAIKTAGAELAGSQGRQALNTIDYLIKSISDMIYKEENILFPMAMELLTDADWQKVGRGEDDIGYAWIEPETGWSPGSTVAAAGEEAAPGPATLKLSTGQLTPEQVNLILTHLPVELSFVDENDEVRYYSQVPDKIFPRSPGVIGRRVQKCHPPASLDKVQKILDDFRSGRSDVADFWLEMKDRFIYIRYFPVRDADGVYRGTLEVAQDVTELRKLTGEKRLYQ
ncbi:MAG TPA: DUF438 domain-containing protein [Actinobacteria bacterium]|nr:DUF438 domain-containing protein [Actinomycetota bacterium]